MSVSGLLILQPSFAPTQPQFLLPPPAHLSVLPFPNQNRNYRIFSTQTTHTDEATATTTPAAPTSSKKMPISTYLMERLSFSKASALAVSKYFKSYRKKNHQVNFIAADLILCEKADSVVSFLQDETECGLNLSQTQAAITKYPSVLTADVDKTLKPKLELLKQELGFSRTDLVHVLTMNPRLVLSCELTPAIQALREFMDGNNDFGALVKKLTPYRGDLHTVITKNMIPNITMLINEYGIPRDSVQRYLCSSLRTFVGRTEWLRDVLVKTEDKWGISRNSGMFLAAVRALSKVSDEKIESKCQVFRSFGWEESDILSLVRSNPSCIGYSEAKLRKSLEYYVNELGFQTDYIASNALLFSVSLEHRVKPRYRVLSILKAKGLVRGWDQLHNVLKLTDNQFITRFILRYENIVPEIRQVYAQHDTKLEPSPQVDI